MAKVDGKGIVRRLKSEISALESRLDENNQLMVALREQLKAHEDHTASDRRTQVFRRAAIDMVPQDEDREFSNLKPVLVKDMSDALVVLGSRLDHKYAEINALSEISQRINAGIFFDEVLDHVFEHFQSIIPYDRIGVALTEKTENGVSLVRAQWARANYDTLYIHKGYAAAMKGSSLQDIADTREPRILNDLNEYLSNNPKSHSTRLILREGIQSSLTCPLIARGNVIGFIFFSSRQVSAYQDSHVELFSQIAGELAMTLEKSRAYEDLYLRNEFIKKVFGQYVTSEVVDAVLKSDGPLALGGERRTVTVLMADLRGFTPMSERLSPEEVVDALNVFLGKMTEVVMKYGGSIDNFIGDAVMAVFGTPIAKSDDVECAVACAIEMQNTMAMVNEEIEGRGLPDLTMGIGISTGEVVAGNIGSEMRVKYSVIGNTVNLAARIESIASGGQIFTTEATFKEVQDVVHSAGNLSVQLKGLSNPVPIYEVIGIDGKYAIRKTDAGSDGA